MVSVLVQWAFFEFVKKKKEQDYGIDFNLFYYFTINHDAIVFWAFMVRCFLDMNMIFKANIFLSPSLSSWSAVLLPPPPTTSGRLAMFVTSFPHVICNCIPLVGSEVFTSPTTSSQGCWVPYWLCALWSVSQGTSVQILPLLFLQLFNLPRCSQRWVGVLHCPCWWFVPCNWLILSLKLILFM